MKATKTVIAFEKETKANNGSYFTNIEIIFGTNPKGEKFQRVNQIDTANEVVHSFSNYFEELKFTPIDMILILSDQGYKLKF